MNPPLVAMAQVLPSLICVQFRKEIIPICGPEFLADSNTQHLVTSLGMKGFLTRIVCQGRPS